MRGADEPAGIVAFRLLGLVVDNTRAIEIGAHRRCAGQESRVDAGVIHHPDVLIEIIQQRMHGIAGRTILVEMNDQAISRILLDQFARREMVLKVNDHRFSPAGMTASVTAGRAFRN